MEIKTPEYLYHYTSIETLALILKYKTVRFNSLKNVDDKTEVESSDLGQIGKHFFVSCWTDLSDESIPLWSLYTEKMTGVRIKMRTNIFREYTYKQNEYGNKKEEKIHVDLNTIDPTKPIHPMQINSFPFQVEYKSDEQELKPKLFTQSVIEKHIRFDHIEKIESDNIATCNVGKYKHTDWQFQREWRYEYLLAPKFSEQETKKYLSTENNDVVENIKNPNIPNLYEYYDFDLKEDAFDGLEVLAGPCMEDGDYILLESLLEKYCTKNNFSLNKSKLQIKTK